MNAQTVNDRATLRVYYGENGKGVKNENIILNCTYSSDSKLTKATPKVTRTDDNGVAYIDVYPKGNNLVDKVSYTITTERDKTIVKEGTFSFATIATSPIDNLNGVTNYDGVDYAAKGYAKLVVSENDANGASKGNGLNWSASTENTYATDAQYITLKDVKPNELTYATMNFASLSLSKYTRLDTWKTYADNNKIVLTFTQDILASSVIVDQFTVKRDGANANSEIASVTVSGKSIIITLKHPITDGIAADFTVTMNKANVGGIEYNVVTTNGDKVVNAATNYIIHNDTNSKKTNEA